MKQKLDAYIELMKPGIMGLVLVTTALGYYLGGSGVQSWRTLIMLLLGTSLTCGGSAVLNHYLERDADAKMRRTMKRPLPLGLVNPSEALLFGIVIVLLGTVLLVGQVNLLTGYLSLLTAFLYVLVYTPLKRVTWMNTMVGAIPGAIPPLGGWAAATGDIGVGAWILFAILFLWQHPHFYAIAWMYREDYERGGFKMLPVVDPSGRSTFRQILFFSIVLIPISILPSVIGISGWFCGVGTALLGIGLLVYGTNLWRSGSMVDARRLMFASIAYLPILLLLIVADRGF